ncbi:MAG: hypothetical protein K0A93_10450 [Desulfuromonadaceae bacterium]|nr:hypothetical protein [Desulfuromonadaceae bacterium]
MIGWFLLTCHAVIEGTLIFVAIGGNGWQMLGIQVVLARFWRWPTKHD